MEELNTELPSPSSGKAEYQQPTKEEEESNVSPYQDVSPYQELVGMMVQKNVKGVRYFLTKHPGALTAKIDDFGSTIFHYLAQDPANNKLLKELVPRVLLATLKILNERGISAVHCAACAGNNEALRAFAERDKGLLRIEDTSQGKWHPIHHAAIWGREQTVRYLLEEIEKPAENEIFPDTDFEILLQMLVTSNLHG